MTDTDESIQITNKEIQESIQQSIEKLPHLKKLLEGGAEIFGGFVRFHVECYFDGGVTDEKLYDYLEAADVDLRLNAKLYINTKHIETEHMTKYGKVIHKTTIRNPTMRDVIKDIVQSGGYVDYRGVDYDGGHVANDIIIEGTEPDANENDIYDTTLKHGCYMFWIPRENGKYWRYDIIYHKYDAAWLENLDFDVNAGVFGKYDERYAARVKKEYYFTKMSEESIQNIRNKKFQLSINTLQRILKKVYRATKLWKRGYRPANPEAFKKHLLQCIEISKPYIDFMNISTKPIVLEERDHSIIKYNNSDLERLTLELFLQDETIKEIMFSLGCEQN